jgi:tetratricopeptide (TPR) repeat protein
MLQFSVGLRRTRIVAIALVILLSAIAASWAATSENEICDLNADFALGLEDYPAAIALHRKFLRSHRNNALAHYHLGFAYGMTGRTTDEINEYLAAARLGLDKWDLFLNLGLAYLGQNDCTKAINTLQIAVLLGPDHPEAHFNLAIAYERSSRLREALQEVTASLLLAPSDPDEHNTKAIICAELGDRACARDEWAHLVQVAPDYTPARINLAILSGLHMPMAASTSSALNGKGLALVLDHGERVVATAISRDRPNEPPFRPHD